MKKKRTTSFWDLSEIDKIKKIEPKIQRFFMQKTLGLEKIIETRGDSDLKDEFRGYLETKGSLGKKHISSKKVKGYDIDFILRQDEDKPIFLTMEFDKIKERSDAERFGERSWIKLADIRASLKVWVYLTDKPKNEADKEFKKLTKRMRVFLKERGDIKEDKSAEPKEVIAAGRFIALRVLKPRGRKYIPIGQVIIPKYGKELYGRKRKVRRKNPLTKKGREHAPRGS